MSATAETISAKEVTNPLVTVTVQEFMKSKGFVSIHKSVRKNANGYPYITFINADNQSENIYFSKASGEDKEAGQLIQRGFFDKLNMAETTNADGEVRTKIVGTSSERLGVADLF